MVPALQHQTKETEGAQRTRSAWVAGYHNRGYRSRGILGWPCLAAGYRQRSENCNCRFRIRRFTGKSWNPRQHHSLRHETQIRETLPSCRMARIRTGRCTAHCLQEAG